MLLKIGKELGGIIEEEAQTRGLTPGTLARIILGNWAMETGKKRAKRLKKAQNQSVATIGGTPSEELKGEKEPATA